MGGFGSDPVEMLTHGILNAGSLAVGGFFVLSGFLLARSGERTGPTRFLWHRVLRIYPAFWTCLIVTAFIVAPIMYAAQFGSLHGFLAMNDGPIAYVYHNATLIITQQNIGQLMSSYPDAFALNGSLWTLASGVQLLHHLGAARRVHGLPLSEARTDRRGRASPYERIGSRRSTTRR